MARVCKLTFDCHETQPVALALQEAAMVQESRRLYFTAARTYRLASRAWQAAGSVSLAERMNEQADRLEANYR